MLLFLLMLSPTKVSIEFAVVCVAVSDESADGAAVVAVNAEVGRILSHE